MIQRYLSKISGPLLDRIDLHIDVAEVKYKELTKAPDGEPSAAIAGRVREARAIQLQHYQSKRQNIFCNAQIGPAEVERHCRLDAETKELLANAVRKLGFSARAYDRVLKVGRTIADLEASEPIRSHHISEAIQYRWLDRNYWERM